MIDGVDRGRLIHNVKIENLLTRGDDMGKSSAGDDVDVRNLAAGVDRAELDKLDRPSETNAFSNIQTLIGGNHQDRFYFSGPDARISRSIDGGAGIRSSGVEGAGGQTLPNIQNTLDYSGYTGKAVALTLGAPADDATAIANIDLIIGNENANNTLIGADTDNTWNITGLNSGNIDKTVYFATIQNLTGGGEIDIFRFIGEFAEITGQIDGGGGSNTLDYSRYTGDPSRVGFGEGILNIGNIIFPPAASYISPSILADLQGMSSIQLLNFSDSNLLSNAEESDSISSDAAGETSNEALENARQILRNIGGETGVRPSLIYVFFTPSGLTASDASDKCNHQALTATSETNTTAADFNCWLQEEDRLHLVMVTAEGDVVRTPVAATTRKEVLHAAKQFLQRTTNPVDLGSKRYLRPAQRMYRWLIAPLEEELQARGIQFYEQLRTVPIKAEALRLAQLAMLRGEVRLEAGELVTPNGEFSMPLELVDLEDRDFVHPYYWSGFTIVGNPW